MFCEFLANRSTSRPMKFKSQRFGQFSMNFLWNCWQIMQRYHKLLLHFKPFWGENILVPKNNPKNHPKCSRSIFKVQLKSRGKTCLSACLGFMCMCKYREMVFVQSVPSPPRGGRLPYFFARKNQSLCLSPGKHDSPPSIRR